MNKKKYWDLGLTLMDCPTLELTLFGEEIDLAILRYQKWGPDPSEGVGEDIEVTEMAWKSTCPDCSWNGDGWHAVNSFAVLTIERYYKPKLMEAIDRWERGRTNE